MSLDSKATLVCPTFVVQGLGRCWAVSVDAGGSLAGRRPQDMAPSGLPVCERPAATSSVAAAVLPLGVSVCSFHTTWFTIEPPQTQATASAPHRSELQLQKGPLSVNNPTLSLGPPSPRVVDAPTRCCLRYLSTVFLKLGSLVTWRDRLDTGHWAAKGFCFHRSGVGGPENVHFCLTCSHASAAGPGTHCLSVLS